MYRIQWNANKNTQRIVEVLKVRWDNILPSCNSIKFKLATQFVTESNWFLVSNCRMIDYLNDLTTNLYYFYYYLNLFVYIINIWTLRHT